MLDDDTAAERIVLEELGARRMCFVFLKATGSKAMATADLESHHMELTLSVKTSGDFR